MVDREIAGSSGGDELVPELLIEGLPFGAGAVWIRTARPAVMLITDLGVESAASHVAPGTHLAAALSRGIRADQHAFLASVGRYARAVVASCAEVIRFHPRVDHCCGGCCF